MPKVPEYKRESDGLGWGVRGRVAHGLKWGNSSHKEINVHMRTVLG